MNYLLQIVGLLRCILKLGPWQTFKLRVLAPRMDRNFLIYARDLKKPILIRGKTSDVLMVDDIIVRSSYSGFVPTRPRRILDAGANIGLASVYWKQMFPETEIVAVEPDQENFEVLKRNTAHLEHVTLVNGGLWSKRCRLSVQYPDAQKYAIRVMEDENGIIQAHSVNSIMEERGWDWIDVVKLDVEGSEVEILSGADLGWINKIGTLIVEIHQDFAPDSARVLFKAFAEQNFHFSWRGENLVLTRNAAAVTCTH